MRENNSALFIPSFCHRPQQHLTSEAVTPMTRKKKRSPGGFKGSITKASRGASQPTKRKFYAVRCGRGGFAGVLTSWDECTLYVTGISGAIFKSFKTYEEAHSFAFPGGQRPENAPLLAGGPSDSGQVALDNATVDTPAESATVLTFQQPFVAEPDPEGPRRLIVYTDGACSRNGKLGSKAGYGVFFHENSPYNVSSPLPGPPTNQRAEMTAVLEAMQIVLQHGLISRGGVLEVHTDSMYTKNGIEKWTANWKKKNWKTAQGSDVKNKDLWVALDQSKSALRQLSIEVSLRWVRGHSGNPGNEAADRLAVEGLSRPT